MEIRFYIDPETGLPHIANHDVSEDEVEDVLLPAGEDRQGDEARVRRVVDLYESQNEDEATEEDEAVFEASHTVVEIPADLLPAVRELLARRRAG